MTSMKKRIAALALALVMCIGMLPGSAFATDEELENAASTVVTGVEGADQESTAPESTTPETETATGDPGAIVDNSATVPEGTVIETEDQEEPPAAPAAPATQDDLDAAFEKVGETDDVDTALAALDEYLAVYDRLSDEDKAANAEALAMAQAYRDSLVAGKEAGENGEEYEDPDIELLYGPFSSVPLYLPIKCPNLTGSYTNVVYTWMQYISRSEACGSNTNASYSANVRFVDNGTNYVMVVDVKVGNWSTSTTTNYTVPKSTHDAKTASGSVTGSLSFNTQGGNTSPITVYGGHVHKFTVQGAWKTAPDCIHDGVAYFTCSNSNCSESTTKTVTGSKLGHSFPTTWNDGCTSHEDAGCTQHSHVCTRCNGTLSGGTETATHTYPTEWTEVTPPTTTSKGREKKVCTACGHTIYRDIDKLEEPTTASYTVNWYDTNGNDLKAPETRNGTVGTTVSATDKDKNLSAAGYIYLPAQSTSSAKLAASGTELKLYFVKAITVTWLKEDGTQIKQIEIPYGDDSYKNEYPSDQSTTGKWGDPQTDEDGNITIRWEEPEATVTYVDTKVKIIANFAYGDADLWDTITKDYSLSYVITNPNVPDFKLEGTLPSSQASDGPAVNKPGLEWNVTLKLPQSYTTNDGTGDELYGVNKVVFTANYTSVEGYVYGFVVSNNALVAARTNPNKNTDSGNLVGTGKNQTYVYVFNGYALPQKAVHTYYDELAKTTKNGEKTVESKSNGNNNVVYSGDVAWREVKAKSTTYNGKNYICVSEPSDFTVRLNTVPFRFDYVRAVTVTWLDKDGGQIQKVTIPNGGDYSELYPNNPSDTGKWGNPQTDGNGNITIQWEEPVGPVNPDPTYAIKVTKDLNTTGTVKNGDVVEYTVTVTNKSTAPLYNLAIDDTADAGLSLKEIVSATYKNGESTTNITLHNVKPATENGKTVNTWEGVLTEFAVDGVVTLTYKATVTNEGTEKVTLANVAHAKGFTTAPTVKLNSAKSVAPVGIMLLSNDGYDVEDSSSSNVTVVIPPAKDYVEDWSDERTDAEGTGSNGGTKVDVDPTDPTPVDPNAPVEITKTADKTTDVKVGDVITYTVKITNKTENDLTVKVKDTLPEGLALGESINIRGAKSASGSVTGTGTVVTPENIADILAGINHHKATSFDNLEVTIGAGKTVELTYTATVQEGATGKLTNKATATVEGKNYEATADVTVKGEEPGPGPDDPTDDGKGISITKTRTSAETAKVGDKITWNIVVKNESNVEKTVTLTELDGVSLSKTSVTLAAGASETVTAEYTVTGNETVDAEGKFFNTVKGSTGKTGDKENPEAKDDGTKIDKSEDPETVTVTWKSGYGDNVDLKVKNDHVKGAEVIQGDYPANPTRPGNYAFNGWGTPVVDPVTGNITITATWRYTGGGGGNNDRDDDDDDRDPTPTPTPTPSTEPSVEPTPAPSTEPTPAPVEEELNDQETPLTDIPEVEDLEDQETPLAGLPEELEEMEDLEDQDVPLAEAPQTGDPASLWGMAAGLSGAGFLLLSKGGKKKEEEED